MKIPERTLAPHVRSAIAGAQAKMSPNRDRPLANHVKAAIQAKPAAPVKPAVPAKAALQAKPAPAAVRIPPGVRAVRPPAPPRSPSRAAVVQRAEDPNLPRKFWVKGDDGQYVWHDEEMDPNDYYSIGEKHRSHLFEYPVYKAVPSEVKSRLERGVDHSIWDPLAAPLSPHLVGKGTEAIVDHLFRKFCNSGGTGYDVMGTSGPLVFDRTNYNGNSCIGLVNSFKAVLDVHGIESQLVHVRGTDQPPFVARVANFIDSKVQGHIFVDDIRIPDYFKFTNHAALWIPDLGYFYDPMATTRYRRFEIDADLVEVGQGIYESIPGSGPLRISHGNPFVLTESLSRDGREYGGFRRTVLTRL